EIPDDLASPGPQEREEEGELLARPRIRGLRAEQHAEVACVVGPGLNQDHSADRTSACRARRVGRVHGTYPGHFLVGWVLQRLLRLRDCAERCGPGQRAGDQPADQLTAIQCALLTQRCGLVALPS